MHPEDDTIYKDTLLQSYQQAIDEGHLEMSLKPALDRFNEIRGVVTTYSCEGHPERDIFHARVDLAVSRDKWAKMQTFIEELLPRDGGIMSLEFCYHSGEDDIQQHVTVRTHPALVQQKAVKPLIDFADRLEELTKTTFDLGELAEPVVAVTKRLPEDWPRKCEKCGSRDIKVTYSDVAGVKRVSYVECDTCQQLEFRRNTCPRCYGRMSLHGSRGGVYCLQEIPEIPNVFRCPHCKSTYVKGELDPVPIVLELT